MKEKIRKVTFYSFFICVFFCFFACKNSSEPDTDNQTILSNNKEALFYTAQQSVEIDEYIPLNDMDYPFAGLPRLVIRTENEDVINSKETAIPSKIQFYGENAPESPIFNVSIHGRGNTSWNYPKKPYIIEFEKKQSLLGMPKAKKWILLANYIDRTLIRNAVAFEIARRTDLEWTPKGYFVEVFLNKNYIGNYYLCEKIENKKNRLNLEQDSYLLEFDINTDSDYNFKTKYGQFSVYIKYPNNPNKEQINKITSYIDSLEFYIYKKNIEKFSDYIDVNSLVDYFLVQELAKNDEIQFPKSLFMYKEGSDKLKFGPVWDFDWGTFSINKRHFRSATSFWFDKLISSNTFKKELKKHWNAHKTSFSTIPSFVDSLADYTRESNNRNIKIWPIDVNFVGDETEDFDTAIQMLKESIQNSIVELDSLIDAL